MGRYYNGDIEGKFWFGVQDSDDAEQFGATAQAIVYYADDVVKCQNRLQEIENELGEDLAKLTAYFKTHNGYTTQDMKDLLGDRMEDSLELFASHILGKQIKACLIAKGDCEFEAEL